MPEQTQPHASQDNSAEELARQLRDTRFRLNQKIVQVETLHRASLLLGASLENEEIAGEFLLLAVAMVDARGGFLFLRDEPTRRLELVEHANLDESQIAALSASALHDRLKRVMRSNAPLFFFSTDLPGGLGAEYLLVVPIGREGLVGVVDKETRQGIRPFSEEDAHLFELIAQQAGAALANARLYRNVVAERNLNQSIVKSIANGVISTNLRGSIVRVNPVVERIFAGEEKLLGLSCVHLFRRHGCTRISAAVRASLQDGQERHIDTEQIRGGNLSLEAHISPLRDEQEEVKGLVVALEDLTEQTRLCSMFKQYASDQVVDLLLEAGLQPVLGGEQRVATMLFVDVVGSAELMGQIGAEEMVRLLNDCFTRMVDIVFDFNGTLDKYTGDGFLAVFGAPVSFDDDVERAARCALAIREEMECFNRERQLAWGLKMGISQGAVVGGNIGSPRRLEYTVIGSDVILAARLSDRAKADEILVSGRVRGRLDSRFDFVPEGRQLFKGIRDPIEIYRLVGPRGALAHRTDRDEKITRTDRSARVDLNIPMIPDMELTATQTAEAMGHFMKLDADKIEEIKMALIEACINAFEHSQSKDGRLQIDFEVTASEFIAVISDRGHGFDVDAAHQKVRRRRESGQQHRGWGLQLMKEHMDEVEIHSDKNGTTITLIKHR